MIFHEVMDLHQSPPAVFAFASDFNNLSKWDPTIVGVQQTSPGPVGKGTTFRIVLRFLGVENAMDYVVAVYEPNSRAVLEGTAPSASATDKVTVEETPTGARLTWDAEIRFKGFMSYMDPILRMLFYQNVRQGMANLKAAIEHAPQAGMSERGATKSARAG